MTLWHAIESWLLDVLKVPPSARPGWEPPPPPAAPPPDALRAAPPKRPAVEPRPAPPEPVRAVSPPPVEVSARAIELPPIVGELGLFDVGDVPDGAPWPRPRLHASDSALVLLELVDRWPELPRAFPRIHHGGHTFEAHLAWLCRENSNKSPLGGGNPWVPLHCAALCALVGVGRGEQVWQGAFGVLAPRMGHNFPSKAELWAGAAQAEPFLAPRSDGLLRRLEGLVAEGVARWAEQPTVASLADRGA